MKSAHSEHMMDVKSHCPAQSAAILLMKVAMSDREVLSVVTREVVEALRKFELDGSSPVPCT